MKCFAKISLLVVTAIVTMLVGSAMGQEVPYRASGSNAQFNPATGHYEGLGNGTLLGRHGIMGDIVVLGDFFPEPGIFFRGEFFGLQVTTAANGDTLTSSLEGDVELEIDAGTGLVIGTWYPSFTILEGTGRFANASGNLTGVAINPPFDPFSSPTWGFNWFIGDAIQLGKGQ